MKKFTKPILVTLLAIVMIVSTFGCFGNFALTRRLYQWNSSVGDKFINNLVFWVLLWIPVYSVATTADFLVLNTIEFWTGTNPMAMKAGDEVIKYTQADGNTYKITIKQNNITVEEVIGANVGQTLELKYNADNQSWYLNDGVQNVKIATVDGTKLNLIYPSGNSLAVDIAQ
jgi:hypothetical protein